MKTEICSFSNFKIYPGHGTRYIRADNKTFTFISMKCSQAYFLKRNPRKTAWTQIYRRLHKKGALEETQKKKARKTQKIQRAIVGASLDDIKIKSQQKPEVRAAAREAALREIKEKKKQQQVAKTAAKKEKAKAPAAAKGGKQQQKPQASKQPKPAKGGKSGR